ncbi:MAG: hypothetical protein M3Z10_15380, partial [Gemmatimonadota bacterium]|nr:hypothetical protein [Gemmatimonadota bacterium]
LEVRATEQEVTSVRELASPLQPLPRSVTDPRAVQVTAPPPPANGAGGAHVVFTNVPPKGLLQIFEPDGSLLRALPINSAGVLEWDLRTGAGRPIHGGLYRARVQGRDAAGHTIAPQLFYFGVVHPRAE